MAQSITVQLPDVLFEQLKRRAAGTHRAIEDELVEVVAQALPVGDVLPADLTEALSPLAFLEDAELWQAARSHLPTEAATQIEALNHKQQREGLTETEAEALAHLVRQYERYMLVRAQAAVLLQRRGYDVSELGPGA